MTVEADFAKPFEHLVGEVLANRYQIESHIGQGAMGSVYRAKHVKVGRAFAVKVLHPRFVADDKTLQRFEREAELAGRLRHPNVIGVVDVGETNDGLRYMVMDFAAGPDLATLMDEAPMPPPRIIHLTRQLLEGLFHAHEAGLIHRDFKPENVIVEKDTHGNEVPRIVDFGIAILREGGDSTSGPGRLTTNGLVLGTPHYMAPEQAVADPIDHRIDLFALGIIVYEMLSGKLPFDGSGAEVARANLLLDPPPIAERVPYISVDPLLEAFARRLMAKKRDQRPATAKAARDLLDLIERDREAAAHALGVPLAAAREPALTQPSAPVRKHTGNETFPPPIRAASEPPQPPPMSGPTAVPARAEQFITTDSADAVPKRRRAPLIAAALVGVGIAAGAAVVMLAGNDDAPARENTDTIANRQPTAVEAPPPGETAPSVEPIVEPAAEPPNAEAPEGTAAEPTSPDEPVANTDETAPTNPTTSAATKPTPAKVSPRKHSKAKTPKVTKAVFEKTTTKPAATKPIETTPVETKPEKHEPIDAGALARKYKAVGAQLKALQDAKGQDAVTDLWSRYRFIRLSDAMSTQEKRDQAAAILSKLATEAAARKK